MTATLQRRLRRVQRRMGRDSRSLDHFSDAELESTSSWLDRMLTAHGEGAAAETLLAPEDAVPDPVLCARIMATLAALRQRP